MKYIFEVFRISFSLSTDNFLSAVLTSAIRSDGSVEYGLYTREEVLSSDYDLPLSNLIAITHNVVLTQTIFGELDCDITEKLFEEIADQIEEDGLKPIQIDGTRDCLAHVLMEECTDYYSVSGDGTTTYLYTSCNQWTETIQVGCNDGYPGDNPGSWTPPINDSDPNGGPRPDPIGDGTDENNDNDTDPIDNRTSIEKLCDSYPVHCDCIVTGDNESDAKLIHRLITDHDHLLDPCNSNSSFMENILSSVCAKNNGNLTSSALLEGINNASSDGLITAYNNMVDNYSTGCGSLNELNQITDNMSECNLASFIESFNSYFGIINEPAKQTNPIL
ncbi:MAG: hypothetical protein P1U56_04770 [Saprospiraceae bacterium]|nr:hypothetical protein [Saprospiraceae bacterium]